MAQDQWISPLEKIQRLKSKLTPKSRILGDYVLNNPRKAVFMTIKDLAVACGSSEATVVRFVVQLGYPGYGEFLDDLRAAVDAELTLLDRSAIIEAGIPGSHAFKQRILEEISNLKLLYKSVPESDLNSVVQVMKDCENLLIIGSRLSYTLAHFMGWMLMKARPNVHILNGSDSTSIDRLYVAPSDSVVVIITVSRYPNELIRLGKIARRLKHNLVLITDSHRCPLISFASQSLIVPHLQIPASFRNITTLLLLVNFIVMEVSASNGDRQAYREHLEQAYQENDLLFSLHDLSDDETAEQSD